MKLREMTEYNYWNLISIFGSSLILYTAVLIIAAKQNLQVSADAPSPLASSGDLVCRTDQFRCLDNSRCIHYTWRCDALRDCDDGSDETNCATTTKAPSTAPPTTTKFYNADSCTGKQFRCVSDGKCIPASYYCDKIIDCDDLSDECCCNGAPQTSTSNAVPSTTRTSTAVPSSSTSTSTSTTTSTLTSTTTSSTISTSTSTTRPSTRSTVSTTTSTPSTTSSSTISSSSTTTTISTSTTTTRTSTISTTVSTSTTSSSSASPSTSRSTLLSTPSTTTTTVVITTTVRTSTLSPMASITWKTAAERGEGATTFAPGMATSTPSYWIYPVWPPPVADPNGCKAGQFTCTNKNCIPAAWRCDGRDDCLDQSDEMNCDCTQMNSTSRRYCTSGTGCISKALYCNNAINCDDSSDEMACYCNTDRTYVRCRSGQCIHMQYWCDGHNDCQDLSDELYCDAQLCPPGSQRCRPNFQCMHASVTCDGYVDCPDYSDETNCGCSESFGYRCKLGLCVRTGSWCNGVRDCPDGSDEPAGCSNTCAPNQFRCENSLCIDKPRLCDRVNDCGDWSDEIHCDCSSFEFKCNTGICIDNMFLCDGISNCPDGDDESTDICSLKLQEAWR